MGWTLDHPRDLAADFRAIYHLSPAETLALDAPEFFALAYRLPAYQGVMTVRASEAEGRERRTKRRRGVRQVDGSREAVRADPLLAEAISFN